MTLEIATLVLLILLSAFFSGLEIALFSLSSAHLRALVEKKARGARVVKRMKARPERLLVVILIGNNLANIGAASMAAGLAIRTFGDVGVGVAAGVMTFLILVFGEITPKTFAYRWSEKISLLFARPLELFGALIFPLVWLMERFTRVLSRLAGRQSHTSVGQRSLLMSVARLGLEEGTINERELRVVESAFRLGHVPADKVMTPRREMVAVEAGLRVEEAVEALSSSPHSRYPVYRGDKDEIVGTLHLRDLYEHLRQGRGGMKIAEAAVKPLFVPRTMVIGQLLRLFQRERVHMAIVVGEYGETAGLVTLEDILEEMVGEIEDEADAVRQKVFKLGKDRWLVDASLPIEDLHRSTGVRLPGEQHHTINGLLLDRHQNIPCAGERIAVDGYTFIVREADARRVILAELVAEPEKKKTPG